jgi:putative membrane protein
MENQEHLTYLKIKADYEEAKRKRLRYKKYGTLFIIISGIIFLTLMFSLDNKISFLILWVITDFWCAALMIHADYKYHKYTEYLGIEDEYSKKPKIEDAEEEE